MKFVTLVPYRPNGGPVGDRYRWLWDQVCPRLEELGRVVTGEPSGATWSRAEAVNDAAKKAGKWDVALVGDCDTVPDPASVLRAVSWALETGKAIRPHMERHMLNAAGTLLFVQRGPAYIGKKHHDSRHAGGGLLVVTREAFDKVGGYNEAYQGWGYEDTDFNLRLLREVGWDRIPGDAWHLFHERVDNKPREESRRMYKALLQEYRRDIWRWSDDKGLARPNKVF